MHISYFSGSLSIFHPHLLRINAFMGHLALSNSLPLPSSIALAYFALLQGQVSNLSEMESSQLHIFSAKTPAAIGKKGKVELYLLYSPRTESSPWHREVLQQSPFPKFKSQALFKATKFLGQRSPKATFCSYAFLTKPLLLM